MAATKAVMSTGVAYLRSLFAGLTASQYRPQGQFFQDRTSASTIADTNETTLLTTQVPAVLQNNGDALEIEIDVDLAATAGSKTVKVNWGSTGSKLVCTTAAVTTASAAGFAKIYLRITRLGAASARVVGHALFGPNDGSSTSMRTNVRASLTDDLTAAVTLQVTGTNGAAVATEITYKQAVITYIPAPPA